MTFVAVLLGAALSLASPKAAAAASIGLGSGTAGPGDAAVLDIQFTGDGSAVALQFDVAFDAKRLAAGFAAGTALTAKHLVSSSVPTPGVARVVIYSLANQALGNGVIATLPFKVLAPAIPGTATLVVSNLLVSSATPARVQPVTATPGSVLIRDSAGPRLQLPSIAANRQATLRVNGVDGKTYTLQGSLDLKVWETVATSVASGGVATFTDGATRPFRFYRAQEAP